MKWFSLPLPPFLGVLEDYDSEILLGVHLFLPVFTCRTTFVAVWFFEQTFLAGQGDAFIIVLRWGKEGR